MNRKNIPLLLMLTAGAVTCIITYVKRYSMNAKLISLFVVLVIFYVLGSILVGTMNYFEKQNEEKLKEEGEVIEKDSDEADQNPEEMNQEEKQ
ncbi:MAG: hypothetical protein HFH92_09045 [Lachnospiraceae bacterium]|jgi:hypothetical protein|uniref:hypothetical protein n=1 Tax=uncultured Acetatifactor sp. TaxID=1671927 RepID=UPI002619EDB8|nr:hypothetical protein [uncultured Acetatifactor sp.]MCI8789239.1 hypothetical protein [Lachnospiraceae bacterium]